MGKIMMARITPAAEKAQAGRIIVTEEARPAEQLDQHADSHSSRSSGTRTKTAHKTVDHAGNCGQQLGKKGQRAAQQLWDTSR